MSTAQQPPSTEQQGSPKVAFSPADCKAQLESVPRRISILAVVAGLILAVSLLIMYFTRNENRLIPAAVYGSILASLVLLVMVAYGATLSRVHTNAGALMGTHVFIMLLLLAHIVLSFLGLSDEGPGKDKQYHLYVTLSLAVLVFVYLRLFNTVVKPVVSNVAGESWPLRDAWPSSNVSGWKQELRARVEKSAEERVRGAIDRNRWGPKIDNQPALYLYLLGQQARAPQAEAESGSASRRSSGSSTTEGAAGETKEERAPAGATGPTLQERLRDIGRRTGTNLGAAGQATSEGFGRAWGSLSRGGARARTWLTSRQQRTGSEAAAREPETPTESDLQRRLAALSV